MTFRYFAARWLMWAGLIVSVGWILKLLNREWLESLLPFDIAWFEPALAVIGCLSLVISAWKIREDTSEENFAMDVVYDPKTRLPLNVGAGNIAREFVRNLLAVRPDYLRPTNDHIGESALYFQVIAFMMVDWLFFQYGTHWDIDISSLRSRVLTRDNWVPVESSSRVLKLQWSQLACLCAGLEIFRLDPSPAWARCSDELALPPRTKVQCIRADGSATLSMSNPFVDVSIRIETVAWLPDVGSYRAQVSTSTDAQIIVLNVCLRARFSARRTDHPLMPKYQKWIGGMFRSVRKQFDYAHEKAD